MSDVQNALPLNMHFIYFKLSDNTTVFKYFSTLSLTESMFYQI